MEPANATALHDDAVLEILYSNFGCFALLTAHKLQMFGLFKSGSLTAIVAPLPIVADSRKTSGNSADNLDRATVDVAD